MANYLKPDRKAAVVRALVEGCSVRTIVRMTDVHKTTILKILVEVGGRCADLLDETMYDLPFKFVQVDEIWSFVAKKQGHCTQEEKAGGILGDQYVFVAMDSDTKVVFSHLIGKRTGANAMEFMCDVGERLSGDVRVQVSSDGFDAYVDAVEAAFGCAVDYGMEVKDYTTEFPGRGRYSPPKAAKSTRIAVVGRPNMRRVSTSYVERQNLTMRMSMRRLTRLTNAFSKKVENLRAAVALHFAYYNFCRVHDTLRVTPAMEARVADRVWAVDDLLGWEADRALAA